MRRLISISFHDEVIRIEKCVRGGGEGLVELTEGFIVNAFFSVIGSFAKLSSSGHYGDKLRTLCVLPLRLDHFLIKTN